MPPFPTGFHVEWHLWGSKVHAVGLLQEPGRAGPLLPGLTRVEVARGPVSLDPGIYSWIDSASIIQRLTPWWQLWLCGWALIIQHYDLLH